MAIERNLTTLTVLYCAIALGVSIYPGRLYDILFFSTLSGLCASPFVTLGYLVAKRTSLGRFFLSSSRGAVGRFAAACLGLVVVSYVLLHFFVADILGTQISPGWANSLLSDAVLWGLFAPVVALIFVALPWVDHVRDKSLDPLRFRTLARPVTISLLTLVAIGFDIPLRAVFIVNQPTFEKMVDDRVVTGHSLCPAIGPYHIDECRVHRDGGTYFRVHTGPDGLGSDVVHYGFCHWPCKSSSPFNVDGYCFTHIRHDWYWYWYRVEWYRVESFTGT